MRTAFMKPVCGFNRSCQLHEAGNSEGSYQALAHLFVGGVIGPWLVSKSRWLLWIAIGLSIVEVSSAIANRVLM